MACVALHVHSASSAARIIISFRVSPAQTSCCSTQNGRPSRYGRQRLRISDSARRRLAGVAGQTAQRRFVEATHSLLAGFIPERECIMGLEA